MGGSQLALEIPESLFDYETPWQISLALAALACGAGYTLLNNKMKKEESSKNEHFTKTLITLKRKVDSLYTEEFNSLIENTKAIKRNMVSDEEFDSAKALSVANSIIEIDATRILDEFEKSNVNSNNNKYKDDTLNVQKGASFKMNGHFY